MPAGIGPLVCRLKYLAQPHKGFVCCASASLSVDWMRENERKGWVELIGEGSPGRGPVP